MNMKVKTAIEPTRENDFPEWFQQVIKAADMAENSPVRGCMVIKPWGYGIWEVIQQDLDKSIKESGHENVYFPLFIPLSYLEKESKHVEGFAKECAVVTHHRLEKSGDKLVPAGELEEPLIVRPTSEMIISEAFSRWISSWRDLPVLINQWSNVVRWEMRTRMFLRTTEFLWQEGHTVHASQDEALDEVLSVLEMYRKLIEEVLAMPVILGKKSPGERFPGAVDTYTMELMMQDRKALQAGTSHYLGQNFAKSSNIQFTNKAGELEYGYMTSWGVTTRLVGGMIMVHGDDDGMRVPPRAAPKHVVILPVIPNPESEERVLAFAEETARSLRKVSYHGRPLVVHVDKRDRRGGEKSWEWIKKGVPLRLEVGPRDVDADAVMLARRDKPHKEKVKVAVGELAGQISGILDEMQTTYFMQAKAFRDANIREDIGTFAEMQAFFTPKNEGKPEIHGGFVKGKWCGDPESEEKLKELKVTIRCLPLEQSEKAGTCIITGRPATLDAIFAKAY